MDVSRYASYCTTNDAKRGVRERPICIQHYNVVCPCTVCIVETIILFNVLIVIFFYERPKNHKFFSRSYCITKDYRERSVYVAYI